VSTWSKPRSIRENTSPAKSATTKLRAPLREKLRGSASSGRVRACHDGNMLRTPWWCGWRPVRCVTHEGNVLGSET
jgi:hypothetical protein